MMRELSLVLAVDRRDPNVRGRLEGGHLVRHLRQAAIEAERARATLAGRDLLNGAAGRRDTEQMRRSAKPSGEVDVPAIGTPEWLRRKIVPVGREIDLASARRRQHHEIDRAAAIHLLRDE